MMRVAFVLVCVLPSFLIGCTVAACLNQLVMLYGENNRHEMVSSAPCKNRQHGNQCRGIDFKSISGGSGTCVPADSRGRKLICCGSLIHSRPHSAESTSSSDSSRVPSVFTHSSGRSSTNTDVTSAWSVYSQGSTPDLTSDSGSSSSGNSRDFSARLRHAQPRRNPLYGFHTPNDRSRSPSHSSDRSHRSSSAGSSWSNGADDGHGSDHESSFSDRGAQSSQHLRHDPRRGNNHAGPSSHAAGFLNPQYNQGVLHRNEISDWARQIYQTQEHSTNSGQEQTRNSDHRSSSHRF